MSQDVDPEDAPIWTTKEDQPYANRTTKAILWGFLIVVIGIIGVIFFILMPNNENKNGGSQSDQSDQSFAYELSRDIFSGIEDGLENNPHNLDNVESIDQFNLDTNLVRSGTSADLNAGVAVERTLNKFEQIDDNYRYSVFDVIGSEVRGKGNNLAGNIDDIIIDKSTGEASTIMVALDGAGQKQYSALGINSIKFQRLDGDIKAELTESELDRLKPHIASNSNDLISLRSLRNGQLLDDQGAVAGEIEAIIYLNAEIQRLYFELLPRLTPQKTKIRFALPFEDLNIVNNVDGYDVQLTTEQTRDLAESLMSVQ